MFCDVLIMNVATENDFPNYEIRVACVSDSEQIVKFLHKCFYEDEPLNKYLKKTYGNYEGRLRHFFHEELLDPTVVAIEENNIIGVSLNRILEKGKDDLKQYTSESEIRQKLLNFLKYIEDESKFFEYFPHSYKGLAVDLISVDEAFRGKGIAKSLLTKAREVAKEKDCNFIVIDCTNAFTAKAAEKLGFKKIYGLKYEDYRIGEKIIFKPDYPHVEASVFVQKIE